MKRNPPRIALRFFRWYCHPKLQDYIEGDLLEVYAKRMNKSGKWIADIRFVIDVLLLFRPGIIKPIEESQNVNNYGMFKSYFKIGWRNLVKDKGYSFINIGGLALGMTVAMLIGLWVWDEITYSKNFKNRDRIAAVMQNLTYGDLIETMSSQSLQLGPELRTAYGSNFKHVVMSSFTQSPILTYGEKSITKTGYFMEPEAPEMFALHMVTGSRAGLKNQNNILLSKSTAHALFGDKEAVGEVLKIDSRYDVIVTGVFEDLPSNSNFQDMLFLAPLDLLVQSGNQNLGWINNWLEVYVELEDGIDMTSASLAIKDAKLKNVDPSLAKFKPELFLFPLSRWHLYGDFENGINTGGRIEFVKLFGAIGGIVLLLACINFMNLSTARAENRAKEVGVRKVVGSLSHQLVSQFFIESFLMVFMAFLISLMMVQLTLPLFNEVANKKIEIDWINPWIWLFGLTIVFVTGLLAGSYPSFYLSRFSPGKVLKGSFRTGRLAALPRKVLVVAQFAISVALVIGTIVIYEQVQYAKSRPLGYQQNGLLFIPMKTQDAKASYQNVRNDLMAAGLAVEVSRSECTVTNMYWSDGGFK